MMMESSPTIGLEPHEVAKLSVLIGLGSRESVLELSAHSRCLDINPWLLDCVAIQVTCLGYHEELPRPWNWENLLTLLEAGEELLYVLDYVGSEGAQTGQPFTLWLAVRFPRVREVDVTLLEKRRQRARALVSQFQRQAFPGSDVSWVDPSQVHQLLGFAVGVQARCVCLSGVPSRRAMRDNEAEADRSETGVRNYQSLNDVAESLVDIRRDFRLAFVIKRVDDDELRDALAFATNLRDAIHPFVRVNLEASANIVGSHADERSRSSGGGHSTPEVEGLIPAAWNKLRSILKNRAKVSTDNVSWNTTTGSTSSFSVATTRGLSREQIHSLLELADLSLERTIGALHDAHGTGGYRWAAFVLGDGDSADLIGGALEGVLAGSRTKDHPLNRFEVRGARAEIFQSSLSLIDIVADAAPILPLPRACDALLLPEAELPGVRLRQNVFLGRTYSPPVDLRESPVRLGPDAFAAIGGSNDVPQVEIPYRDLFRHVLVAGATGSGKTTRVVKILNGLEDETLSVLIFETAKRTYRRWIKRADHEAPLVYTLGGSGECPGSRVRPLRVNPFYFELGTSLKRHVAVLSDALAELMPTAAMIAPLMRRAVEDAYTECGWDIERGRPHREQAPPRWPTVIDFVAQVRTLAQTLNYGPEVTANYRGALENRAALFVDAAFQDIFSHCGNLSIDELLPLGYDVIIEVENLPPSEVDIRAFVMTLLLNRLRATQAIRHSRHGYLRNSTQTQRKLIEAGLSVRGVSEDQLHEGPRRWLVVIEEAHNVLERSFDERRPADESNAGRTLLRCITRLLQEGREIEVGLMVVDQSPANLARSVISNTGTKVVMRLEDGAEMEEIGRTLGLEPDAWRKLGLLQEGEAIVKASYMDTPVKTTRFPEPSKEFNDFSQEDDGWIPSYMDLEEIWKPVVKGFEEPDDEWCERLLTAAHGNTELAGFVGLKVHLSSFRDDPQAVIRTRELRRDLNNPDLDATMLLAVARRAYYSSFAQQNGLAILGVARLAFRAFAEAPIPEHPSEAPIVAGGIKRASELLEMEKIGDAKIWRGLLVRLASGNTDTWSSAVQAFVTYARDAERGEPMEFLKCLFLYYAYITEHPACLSATTARFDPVDLLLKTMAMVNLVVERRPDDVFDTDLERRWAVANNLLHRLLCCYFARHRGDEAVAEVLNLFDLEV